MASGTARPAPPPPPPRAITGLDVGGQFIEQQLNRTRRRLKLIELVSALMLLVAGVGAFILVVALVDHWVIDLGFWGRLTALLALSAGCLTFSLRVLAPLLLHSINPAYAAWTIERSSPALKNSLLNFLFLRTHRSGLREAIYRAIEQRAAADLSHVSLDEAIDRSRLIRVGYLLAAILAVLAAYTIISPKDPLQTIARITMPWADIARPARVTIDEVEPGDAQVFQGQSVTISALLRGARPGDEITLYYSTADRQIVDQPVTMKLAQDGWRHEAALPPPDGSNSSTEEAGLQQDVTYWIEAGDALSRSYQLDVVPAPMIVVESVEYQYPAYTRRPKRVVAQADISALEGTRVTVRARANQPVRRAALELDPDRRNNASRGSALPMRFEDTATWRSFVLELDADRGTPKHRSYQVRFTNEDGYRSQHPVLHHIEVTRDLHPLVEVLTPHEPEVDVPLSGEQLIEVRAVDPDYGLSQVKLSGEMGPRQVLDEILLEDPAGYEGQAILRFAFRPAQLDLQPGDRVSIIATAADNRTRPGTNEPAPNTQHASRFVLHVVADPAASQADGQQEPGDSQTQQADGADEQPAQSEVAEQPMHDAPMTQAEQRSDTDGSQEGSSSEQSDTPQQPADSQRSADPQQPTPPETPQQPSQANDQQQSGAQQSGQQHGEQQSGQQQNGQQQQAGGQQADQPQAGQQQTGQNSGQQTGQQNSEQQQPGSQPAGQQGGQSPSGAPPGSQQPQGAASDRAVESPSDQRQEELHPGEVFEKVNQFRQQQQNGQSGTSQPQATPPNDGPQPSTSPNQGAGKPRSAQQDPSSQPPHDGQPSPGASSSSDNRTPEGQPTPQSSGNTRQPHEEQGEGATPTAGQDPRPEEPLPSEAKANHQQEPKRPASTEGNGDSSTEQPSDPGAGQAGDPQQNPKLETPHADKPKTGEAERNTEDQTKGQPPAIPRDDQPHKKRQSDSEGQSAGERRGGGRQGSGQNTPQPGHQNPGSSSSADQGRGASQERGSGETSSEAGQKQPAAGQTGQPGEQPQTGSGEGQGSGSADAPRPPQSQQPQNNPGQEPGAGGAGQSGQSSENLRDPNATNSSGARPSGGGGLPGQSERAGTARQWQVPDGDEANLDYSRQATEMALEYLEDQQHEPDPRLLEELGWSQEDLQNFLKQWREMQQNAVQTPQGQRELDEALRSLGLRPGGQQLQRPTGGDDGLRGLRDDGARSTPPPQFLEQFNAYKRGTARAATPERRD